MDIEVDEHTVIVFDLDDTLYNELDYLKSAYKSIAMFLEPNDWIPLYFKMFSKYRSKLNVFNIISTEYNVELEILLEKYRNHHPEIQLFDGALDVIKAIKNKKGKIGIVTDGRSATQRSKISSLGLLEYVDHIIISEEIGTEKPDVANFKAIENFLVGREYYYIADNIKKDFIAPNLLGWKSIAVIDNGKNIHFEAYKYIDEKNLPQNYVHLLTDINVI